MESALIIPAFIAGILTFLAPCTLPLVPGYLAFISGVSLKDLNHSEEVGRAKAKIFLNGLFFVFGFSLIFIALGALAGLIGQSLFSYRQILGRLGGILVIIFGLVMLGAVKLPILNQERQFRLPPIFRRGRPLNAFVLGSAFGFGWTPCAGPILGSILALAATSTTVGQGVLLLAVFSLGLAAPFLLVALSVGSAARYLDRYAKYLDFVSVVGGIFLIFLGFLLLTNSFGLWISYFYRLFDFINYDRLLNYL
jgi:cytochrome c-type biogenesis protein